MPLGRGHRANCGCGLGPSSILSRSSVSASYSGMSEKLCSSKLVAIVVAGERWCRQVVDPVFRHAPECPTSFRLALEASTHVNHYVAESGMKQKLDALPPGRAWVIEYDRVRNSGRRPTPCRLARITLPPPSSAGSSTGNVLKLCSTIHRAIRSSISSFKART